MVAPRISPATQPSDRWRVRPPPRAAPRPTVDFVTGRGEGSRKSGSLPVPWTMPVEEFVAGWISGALGLVLGHPFDTIKLLGFFKGMSFPIASIAVVNSVLFGVYSNVLLVLTATSHQERWAQPPSYTHVFTAGCAGGLMQAERLGAGRGPSEGPAGSHLLCQCRPQLCPGAPPFPSLQSYFLAPFDLIKVRLQNQTEPRAWPGSLPPRYRGPVHCAASICREEGPRGLFRGAWALVLRDTPTLGVYFLTYEWLCRQYTSDGQTPSSGTVLVAGGFAGIASWVSATPLDVIKSRMQMDGLKERAYHGVLHCMASSVRQEGLGVFFRGLTINSARAFPVNAVTFLSYEYLLQARG
ncbi:solute carrier family 25 member 45 isoform X2 [Choloepus didactylus]|uniref:solute carrier family 25 member 45 isoform X2 n=1 Tax=Choloepus didactylus TaxID=27675 RepID=UPI00189CB1CF|nr:solute carrier family 25 member 45 isoform X2 [Choloepus didactylus]